MVYKLGHGNQQMIIPHTLSCNTPFHGAHPLLKLGEMIVYRQSLFLGGVLDNLQVLEEDLS